MSRRKPLAFAAGAEYAAGYGFEWAFFAFCSGPSATAGTSNAAEREAATTSYAADYLTRNVRRTGG